jgi:hypothetical protein
VARSQTKPKHTCFNCKEPTRSSVASKKQKRTTYICMSQSCWDKYWKREESK